MKLSNSALAAAASGPESAASSLAPGAATMDHPFAELIGLQVLEQAAGRSTLQLSI